MIRPCIRLCAIAALRWAETLAGMRVFDSDNSPLLEALKPGSDSPYITVYTDDDTRTDVVGMDLAAANRTMLLILEIGVASKVVVEGSDPVLELPATDEGMELALDLVEWQAMRALWQDPHNPWGELLRGMVLSIRRVPSIRGAVADRGVRYAARQVTFHLGNVVSDPVPGVVLGDADSIKLFLDAATSDDEVAISTAASHLSQFLDADASPEWRQVQAWLGLTEQGVRASGIGPLSMTAPDEEAAKLDTEDGSIDLKEEDIP